MSTPPDLESGSAWTAFRRAAVRPSLPALVGTFVVAVLVLCVAAAAITPRWLSSIDVGYLLYEPRDDYMFLTSRTYQIHYGDPQPLGVAILGGSSTMHAITDEDDLSAQLSAGMQQPIPVHNLCVGGVHVYEMCAVLDCLGDRVGGVVVINVSPYLLTLQQDSLQSVIDAPRIAIDSDVFDQEVRRTGIAPPRRTGVYLVDHRRFLAPRLWSGLQRLLTGPIDQPQRQRLGVRAAHKRVSWQWVAAVVEPAMSRPDPYRVNLGVLSRMIQRQQQRGPARIVLLETTWAPAVRQALDPRLFQHYDALMAGLASAHNVQYWNLNREAQLARDDFDDLNHINSAAARQRYTRALTDRLKSLLAERAMEVH